MATGTPDRASGAGGGEPLVTVVLPSRDRPVEVRRAAATVIAQTFTDWELVIVDDGSDPAADVVGLRALDDRISVLRNDVAQGVSRARNRGIAAARGTWIAFLDDDDVWHPRKLEAQLAAAAVRDATFVYTASTVVELGHRVYVQDGVADAAYAARLLQDNVVRAPSSVLVRADALAQTTGFDPAFSVVADWDLWLRLSEHVRAACVADPLTGVVEHPGSMQLVLADQIGDELGRLRARYAAPARAAGARFASAGVRRWHAERRWAAHRTPLRAAAYAWAVLRCNGVRGTLRKAAQHHAWRQADVPEWIARQLDTPVILPVGAAPVPGDVPALRAV